MTEYDLQSLVTINRFIHAVPRLLVMTHLYTCESEDFLTLQKLTNLTVGNLSAHLKELESAGYVRIEKTVFNHRSRTTVYLSELGRGAYRIYKQQMQALLESLPE